MKQEEYDIIRRVQQGHINDFELLVKRHQAAVLSLLYQMLGRAEEAEEVAQDVFVKAFENIGSFNFKSRFFSWVYRIAINTAISYREKERRFLRPEKMPEQGINSTENNVLEKERNVFLRLAVNQLKEKYRVLIVLSYFEQRSYAEMAEVLEIPEKKVKSRLFDARKQLHDRLLNSGIF
jgi:RNA polymerase sigma-70 factor, ECF subfamily